MKKPDKTEKAMLVLLVGFLFWILASFTEVNQHSLESGYQYNKNNAFVILTEVVK